MNGQERHGGYGDLIGRTEAELAARFGEPVSRANTGGEVWLVFEPPPGALRARCRLDEAGTARVGSWTLSFTRGRPTLSGAARELGLWPAAEPDAIAAELDAPLVRRPLRAADGGVVHSLTATIRSGRFDRVSVFDEPPDWL